MILYIGNPKDATKKLFKLVNRFNKVAEYKINTQKSVVFLYTNNFQKKKLKNNPIYNCINKKKYLRINLTKEVKELYMHKHIYTYIYTYIYSLYAV